MFHQIFQMLAALRRQIDSTGRLLLVALGLAALAAPALAQTADIVIPNFWDPRAERAPAPAIDGIRFVTTDDFPPFNFTDADGRLVGFNVDLARAICEELQVPCTVQVRPFDDLVAALAENRADAAIAGIAINAETRRSVAFSDVYLRLPARFAVRRDSPVEVSAEALAGRRIAVVAGTAHEAYLAAFFPGAVVVPYADAAAARTGLRTGESELLFGDGLQLSYWLEGTDADGCCTFAGGPYLETAFFGQGLAIAIRPEAAATLAAVNAALRTIGGNGVYATLYLRYFPLSFY